MVKIVNYNLHQCPNFLILDSVLLHPCIYQLSKVSSINKLGLLGKYMRIFKKVHRKCILGNPDTQVWKKGLQTNQLIFKFHFLGVFNRIPSPTVTTTTLYIHADAHEIFRKFIHGKCTPQGKCMHGFHNFCVLKNIFFKTLFM